MPNKLFSVVRRSAEEPPDHEQAFLARYRTLSAYARRLADGHRDVADDLIHDAFVQFVLTRPDLSGIEHLDGYLITLVRNLHVARLRRKANQPRIHVAIEDYDTAEYAIEKTWADDRLTTREALVRVCAYACRRKDTWKGASALILRFFHGFYPTETDRIMHAPDRTTSRLLSQARAEARDALCVPAGLERPFAAAAVSRRDDTGDDPVAFLAALQGAILQTSVPPCPNEATLREWYAAGRPPIGVTPLSHIVSCRPCLEAVGAMLHLPPLEERFPMEPPDGASGGRADGDPPPIRRAKQRGARDVHEHCPKQLHISVNGLPVGLLAITAAESRVTFTVRVDEPIAFAELHSEQDLRMLWLSVAPATEGDVVQRARVALSHDRWIAMAIDLSAAHPAIVVEYVDPGLSTSGAVSRSTASAAAFRDDQDAALATSEWDTPRPGRSRPWPLVSRFRRVWSWAPAAGLLLLALAGVSWWRSRVPTSPETSAVIEEAIARETGTALSPTEAAHRTLRFEVRRADSGLVEAEHRIERWARGGTSLHATRVFDAAGHVVAGRWTDAEQRTTTLDLGPFDEVWQTELSAAVFRDRYQSIGTCATRVDADTYTITCSSPSRIGLLEAVVPILHAETPRLQPLGATLVLRRRDHHAVRLGLALRDEGVERLVSIEERALVRLGAGEVPPGVFEPDSRLSPGLVETVPARARPEALATPSLEIQVVDALDRLPGSEYLSVTRRSGNRLSVTGLVSDATHKQALLAAIGALAAGSLVTTEVSTFAEAATRQRRAAQNSPPTPRVELREPSLGPPPVEQYLQARVPPGTDVSALVSALAPLVLSESNRARQHAVALRTLIERFPADSLASLDAKGRAAWQAMAKRRAAECLAALTRLDAALAPYFRDDGGVEAHQTDEVSALTERLVNETSTIEQAIAAAFSTSERPSDASSDLAAAIDVRQHVLHAQHLARSIQALSGNTSSWR